MLWEFSLNKLLPLADAGEYVGLGGGSAVQDPKTGRWYLGVDEMSEHCGLGTWHTNSHCIIASSTTDSPGGPYVREMVVVDPWCHGSSLAVDPLSSRWIFG